MTPMLDAAEKNGTDVKIIPMNFAQAVAAYDSGDFTSSAEFFRSRISKNSPDPALL